jgi:hypothetical protein
MSFLKNKIQQAAKINELASSNKPPVPSIASQTAKINQLRAAREPMPSIGAVASNLAQSVLRNAQSVAAGNPLKIDEVTAQSRLSICKGCEFYNAMQERCMRCGCFMAVKTHLKAEKCPVGKW